jgi:hypothetical protein
LLQGSGKVVSVLGFKLGAVRVAPGGEERRKNGRVKPAINNVHYW